MIVGRESKPQREKEEEMTGCGEREQVHCML